MGCWNDVIAGKYGKARSRWAIGRKPRTTSKVRDRKREVGPSQAEIGMAGGGDGKREAGSGKREAGSGKREVGNGGPSQAEIGMAGGGDELASFRPRSHAQKGNTSYG